MIQWNAIKSWTMLDPRPDIILLGGDAGTKEAANEFDARYYPDIRRNESGVPLVGDLFAQGERLSTTRLLAYVNSDIILTNDFARAVEKISLLNQPFLLAGERWGYEIQERIEFEPDWEIRLRKQVLQYGASGGPSAIDYFVFTRGLWRDIPMFALGRFSWDNWLLAKARESNAHLIDATPMILAVHQNHPYPNPGGREEARKGKQAQLNRALYGTDVDDFRNIFTLRDSTHRLSPRGKLVVNWPGKMRAHLIWPRSKKWWQDCVWFPFLDITRPLRHRL